MDYMFKDNILYELVMEATTTNSMINNKNDKNKFFFCKSIETVCNDSGENKEESTSTIVHKIVELCEHDIIEDYVETGVESNMVKIRYCQICEVTFT
mgnify:CR=1 FL=1